MPYILAILAALLALYGLYQFMLNANTHQVKSLFLSACVLGVAIAVVLLALTGRLPAAIGVIAALAPIIMGILRARRPTAPPSGESRPPRSRDLTRAEALEILGLSGEPEENDIQDAYRRLMKSMHPDQKGSPWVAERLNAARDRLLKKGKKKKD
ncbi:molecular chaperone DnaJ [Micavibrio aeruginosavorus]|uniref:molecular chaperone DnaJ n=1 Tax=Micavibrio aeruginosavorus TaxID=349221 RepID=UPI003F4AAF1D